jgi:hypothetical protein
MLKGFRAVGSEQPQGAGEGSGAVLGEQGPVVVRHDHGSSVWSWRECLAGAGRSALLPPLPQLLPLVDDLHYAPAGHHRRAVTAALQVFAFGVSAEGVGEGGEFTRRLLPGPFHPTTMVDYCDSASGHHDD